MEKRSLSPTKGHDSAILVPDRTLSSEGTWKVCSERHITCGSSTECFTWKRNADRKRIC